MHVVGLITEYNPFHNGHAWHLQEAKRLSAADFVLCVMSGSFVQRGEPAVLDKWTRAQMAIAAGADVVLELPVAFVLRSAGTFARGAVQVLAATGVITHLCFGSESGQLQPLQEVAELLDEGWWEKDVGELIRQGHSFPKARYLAMKQPEALATPNNILGVEYLRAIKKMNLDWEVFTIPRRQAHYHDEELPAATERETIASATAVRKAWQEKGTAPLAYLPVPTWPYLQEAVEQGRGPVFMDRLWPFLCWQLRQDGAESRLLATVDGERALVNRIFNAVTVAGSWQELVQLTKTKAYTWTRIQRVLCQFLLNFTREEANNWDETGPAYLRLLAFSQRGRQLLKQIKKAGSLPLVTRTTPWRYHRQMRLDSLATDLHSLLWPQPLPRPGLDWRRWPTGPTGS
ncbi:nucleotidyltransferase [Carboxydocella sp. JDF658]|uniref:nucleotidyltransferase n=1 Tax=Carboxydocella sp. JDF658 TaxID=1926600 RepID=UPI0009AE6F4A|nr:nucleotidyltransferase [Carboxydocella sp. JDF658]GAW30502.1 hypothetical protein JDF658_02670 [Carboxydocella sp. JDF658]